jgi:hypothetical protein|tara:strand:+ start:2289 stop:3875 length:1587 start_codon:yes stop_codon:yes gene_type:complete
MANALTKEEILREVVKAGKNSIYFTMNYCRISHPQRGLIPFKAYDYQQQLLTDYSDYRFNVILKARQLGISTITAAYIGWLMIFHRDKNILIVATKLQTATNLVRKVKAIIKNLPEWMQISQIIVDNRTSFELSNGSQIKAASTSGDVGRSEALSLLVVDEAAHVEKLTDLWTALYPTLSTGGRCIALSSPNGVGNWFHQTCVEAEAGTNDFYMTTLMWDVHPDRNKAWFDKETLNMSKRQIAQELECNFNVSGETVIHPDDLQWYLERAAVPEYRTGFDRNYWIWKRYDPEKTHLIVADVARGDGKDNSAFHIFELESMEVVAEYVGKPTPDDFAEVLYGVAKEYGNPMMVVENNNIGYAVLKKLLDKGYPNIYHSTKGDHQYIDPVTAQWQSNAIPGFTTSSKTRPLIVAKMEEFMRNKLIKINSNRLLSEMKTFIWHNGRPEAMRSYNDDLVMAFAIGCWVRDTVIVESQKGLEYSKQFLSSISTDNTTMSTTIPGMREHKMTKENQRNGHALEHNQKYLALIKG